MTYDANGDMTKAVNGSNTWQYTYDYEGRLKGVTLNSAAVQANVYDSDGKRVQQTDGSTTTTYVYEGANVVYQKNTYSGAIDKFAFANGLLVSEQCECGYTYYDHENAEGSVSVITEGTTNTLFNSSYLPYGSFYQRHGMTPVGYTGKPYDGATGLYYFGARFYDPAIQRFVTEDSDTGSTMDPQSLDRYVYAMDNPLTILDSTGHAGNPLGVGTTAQRNAIPTTGSLNSWWSGLTPSQQAIVIVIVLVGIGVASVLSIGLATAPLSDAFIGLVAGANTAAGGVILKTAGTVAVDTAVGQNNNPNQVGNDATSNGFDNALQKIIDKTASDEAPGGAGQESQPSANVAPPGQEFQSPAQSYVTDDAYESYPSYGASDLLPATSTTNSYEPASTYVQTTAESSNSNSYSNTCCQDYYY